MTTRFSSVPAEVLWAALLFAGLATMPLPGPVANESKPVCRTDALPGTHGGVDTVHAFYEQLNWICDGETRGSWARRLMDHYFSPDFVGHGGPDNHDYGFTDFRRVVGGQFERHPRVQLKVRHIVGDGDTGVVHVALRNPGGEHLYEYLALYTVRNGQISERWAYGDRNFP